MGKSTIIALVFAVGLSAPSFAEPTLSSLWPNEDGKRWSYRFTVTTVDAPDFTSPAVLQLEGTVMTAGGPAQVLQAWHEAPPARAGEPAGLSPFLLSVWRARPDLRPALEARRVKSGAEQSGAEQVWWPSLLHGGYFLKGAADIQMWQPDWNHATWTYLTADLSVGATFSHHLVPELAPDIWLHGTVAALDDAITTPAGTFAGAVRIDYLIDYGVNIETDESGNELGRTHSETRGNVHYVPGSGPVAMFQEFVPYVWIDCAPDDCPVEWTTSLGEVREVQTLMLTEAPTSVEVLSWGGIKSLYR